jgi:transcriptional regulator with XRE-family HTH domain|nr:MAG TPA: helix-turn-helix domain protein [Caudoviricetes sp.]
MRSLPELVEFIRVSCKSQNSSITKMEKDLKFANGTVGKWANGKRYPPKDKLLLVADFLQISIEELMGEAPEQKEKPTPSEESELNAHAKAILYKYEQLDPAQRVMFEKMLDAALEAAKGDKNEKG